MKAPSGEIPPVDHALDESDQKLLEITLKKNKSGFHKAVVEKQFDTVLCSA